MKRKLFLLLCALLTSVGMWAQDWTGSEVGEGYALLYNVGTGKYFTRGNGWNTQASIGDECAAMTVKLELSSGKYKIRTLTSNGLECLDGGTVYTDQSDKKNSTWTFTEIDAENHVYNIISADNHGGGSGKYLTAEGGSSTIVGPGNDGTSDNAKWKVYLYSDQQAKLADAMSSATSSNPVNVTAFIKDASFGAYQDVALECWTVTASNKNMNGGNLANPCAETFQNGGGKIYQTISELPNGKYEVKCQGFYRKDSGSTPSYLYANSNQVALKILNGEGEGTAESMVGASNSFTAGYYEVSLQVIVTDGSLTVGIQGQPGNWTCFDNFRLNYLGEASVSELQSLFGDLQGEASNTLTNNTYDNVTGSERTNLQTLSVAAATATVDELNEQINNIKAAINDFISSKSSYDSFDVEKASAMDMGVAEGDIVRPTSASNLQDALHALYVQEDAASKAGYTVDATGIFGTWTPQNIDIIAGEHWDGTATTQYYDRYQTSGYTASITNTVTLPAGKYVFKAAARASTGVNGAFNMSVKIGDSDATYKHYQANGNSGKGIDKSGAANYGAGEFANNNNGRGWEWRFISFELDAETSVRMQIYAQMLKNNWVGFSDITLLTTEDNIEICRQIYVGRKDVAEDLYEEIMNADVLQALKDAVVDEATLTTADEFKAATSALNTAIDNANTSINNYVDAKAVIDAASSLDAAGKASYAANENVIALKDEYDDKTLVSVSSAQRTACEEALRTAAKAQTTENADMTLAIVNWDFLNCQNNNFPGWTIEAAAGSNTWANGNTKVEYWKQKAVDGRFDYYQTISGLPNGKYTLSASMWNTTNGQTEEPLPTGVEGQAGVYGTSGEYNVFAGVTDDCDAANLHTYSTSQITVANGTLRLGVKNKETMGGRWFGVDWIKLTFVRALTPAEEAEENYKEALNAAQAAVTAVGTNYGGVFQHTTATYNALSNAVDTYGDVTGDEEAYTEAYNALSSALTNFNNSVNLPDENLCYRMYIAENGVSTGLNLNATNAATETAKITESVYYVRFTADGNTGRYNIKDAEGHVLSRSTGSTRAFKYYEENARGASLYYILNDNGTVSFDGYMKSDQRYAMGAEGKVANSVTCIHPDYAAYREWLIEPYASVEFGASGFATFACDYPVALPDDESVKGYTASIEDATINFNKLTDKLVPANTGVMLSGTANTTMYLPVVAEAEAQSSDFIRGTGVTPGEDDDYYFFAIKKSAAELTFGTFDPASIAIAKNKAYFKINKGVFSAPGARLVISFDDEDPTAINAIEAADAEAEGLKDGKYLIDNKIVLVKNGVKYSANGQKLN